MPACCWVPGLGYALGSSTQLRAFIHPALPNPTIPLGAIPSNAEELLPQPMGAQVPLLWVNGCSCVGAGSRLSTLTSEVLLWTRGRVLRAVAALTVMAMLLPVHGSPRASELGCAGHITAGENRAEPHLQQQLWEQHARNSSSSVWQG